MKKRKSICLFLYLLMLAIMYVPARADDDTPSDPAAPAPGIEWAETPKSDVEQETKLTVHPYGRVELDITTSSRGTNPLDPQQFNGYATEAGPEPRAS